MLECDQCGFVCKNTKNLLKHQDIEHCSKYKNVIFVCNKCHFSTTCIKNIEIHKKQCTNDKILSNTPIDINEKHLFEDQIKQLEIKLKNKNINIMNLRLQLQYEQMKNKVYMNIIDNQTNIKLEDIIKESDNEINIYNFLNGNIPLIVHDFIKDLSDSKSLQVKDFESDKKEYIIENIKKPIKNKKKIVEQEDEPDLVVIEDDDEIITPNKNITSKNNRSQPKFRRVKEYIKTSEKELGTKLKEDVVRVEKELEEIVYNNFDVSHKEISDRIEELFVQIENTRVYTANLFTMRGLRRKLLGKINLEEYTSLILSHVKRLENIFFTKKYTKKKINKIIHNSLNPLDTRLIYYEGYTNIIMDIDDVQKFGLALGVLVHHQKQFTPYNNKSFFNNIKNYGLSLFELQECIEKCLINIYGYHNIIYLNRNKNSKSKLSDPYSFYSLDNVKDHRYWKMECRMEDFTLDFIDNVLPYCINLFRKIYKDVFTDNIYRVDYISKSQITEFDCEQLIQNIICLAKPNLLCKTFQKIIIDNCTFTSTETDKFNLYGDDKLQQKRLSSAIDTDEDVCKIFKRLFDDISTEDSIKLIYNRST